MIDTAVPAFPPSKPFSGQRCPLVAGSVGPYGAFLHNGSEYTGDYAEQMSVQVSLSDLHNSHVRI